MSRGLVACRSPLVSALVASGSVLPGLPQSSMPTCIPQFSLLLEPCTVVFKICCGTVIRGHLVSHVYRSIYSLSGSPQQRPRVSALVGPFWAARNHNPTRTASIFVWVDSFIQALTAKHGMLTPSTARHTTHSSGHGLSSYVSDWLLQQERQSNPGGLKWSPHFVPIVHTSHQTRLAIVEHSQSFVSALSCS